MSTRGDPRDPAAIGAVQKPLWNRSAKAYADVFHGLVTQAIEPTLDAARVGNGTRALDIATGPGIVAAAAVNRGAMATAVDFAEDMVATARRSYPEIDFRVADAADLPFDDESFDAVVMGFALFLLAEPDKALREVRRVLVPGGRASFSVWDWPVPGFDLFYSAMGKYIPDESIVGDPPLFGVSDPDVLKQAIASAGFVDPRLDRLPIVWELGSANELFDALATLRDFSDVSDEVLSAFRSDVVNGAREYERGGRYFVPFPALLLTGTKP